MIDFLKKIALDIKSTKERNIFIKRIDKIAGDLASKDVLLIDITDMESVFDPEKIIVEDVDESLGKITLEVD